jgi:predicted metalloprotease
MQWTPGGRNDIEDARGRSGIGVARLGIGGFLVLLVLSWISGTNLFSLLGTGDGSPAQSVGTSGQVQTSAAEERLVDFVDAVMKDVQDTWEEKLGGRYRRTRVVLFRDAIQSACGSASAATGPFYCPGDEKVYLDLGFVQALSQRFGAPGDFPDAYVNAHEVGHHVQQLMGIHSPSVAMELQADCLAGIWGHDASAHGRFQAGHVELEPGDADEALRAAAAIGDDRLQKMETGRVMPDKFTHGSSAQRVEAFRRGMESGAPAACAAAGPTTTR